MHFNAFPPTRPHLYCLHSKKVQKCRIWKHFYRLTRYRLHSCWELWEQQTNNSCGSQRCWAPSAAEQTHVWLTATEIYLRVPSALPNHITRPKSWCDNPHLLDRPYLKQVLLQKNAFHPTKGWDSLIRFVISWGASIPQTRWQHHFHR